MARYDQYTRVKQLAAGALVPVEHDPDNLAAARENRGIPVNDLLTQYTGAHALAGGAYFSGTPNTGVYRNLGMTWSANDPLGFSFRCELPAVASNAGIVGISGSALDFSGAGSVGAWLTTVGGGSLNFTLYGATGADNRQLTVNVAAYLGTTIIGYWDVRGAVVYINAFAATGTVATAGSSPPAWTDAVTGSILSIGCRFGGGGQAFTGLIANVAVWYQQLTPAEIATLFFRGAVPWESAKVLYMRYASDFAAGVDGWTAGGGGTVVGNQDAVNGVDNVLKFYGDNSFGQHRAQAPFVSFEAGKIYRLKGRLYNPPAGAGAGRTVTVYLSGSGPGGIWSILNGQPYVFATSANWQTFDFQIRVTTAGSWSFFFYASDGGGINTGSSGTGVDGDAVFYLEGVKIHSEGFVSFHALDDGLGYQFQDSSPNRLHAMMTTSGVYHAIPLPGPAPLRFRTDGTTNAQKLGGQSSLVANSQLLRIRARSLSGTPNLILGTSSGGTQIAASIALSTTWKDVPIALTGGIVTALSDLWATASTANVVEVDIKWEPLG